jgi:hypothetical protein
MYHGELKWFQEVFLEFEMGELLLFQEPHRELPERVQGEEAHVRIVMAAHLKRDLS